MFPFHLCLGTWAPFNPETVRLMIGKCVCWKIKPVLCVWKNMIGKCVCWKVKSVLCVWNNPVFTFAFSVILFVYKDLTYVWVIFNTSLYWFLTITWTEGGWDLSQQRQVRAKLSTRVFWGRGFWFQPFVVLSIVCGSVCNTRIILLRSQLHLWGSPFLVRILRMLPFFFFYQNREVVTFRRCGWCMLSVFLLLAFTRLGQDCHNLLSPCDGVHVCTD